MKSYEEATKRPHGYLMLDLKPTTDDQYRLQSNVLSEENIALVNKTWTTILESDRINNLSSSSLCTTRTNR